MIVNTIKSSNQFLIREYGRVLSIAFCLHHPKENFENPKRI